MQTKEESVLELTAALKEQYRWYSGTHMGTAADFIAIRLYELGWRRIK